MVNEIRHWLAKDVFPLWLERGVDWERGGFVENLGADGYSRKDPRRSMVQCRQVFSFRTGLEMGVAPRDRTLEAIRGGAAALLRDYSDPTGSFRHTIDVDGRLVKATPELYTQAFVIFGLANAFALLKKSELKIRALELVEYLNRERRVPGGGYTELGDGGKTLYRSNPHMHLFEAALAWMEIDADPRWRRLADHVLGLCLDRFVDSTTGLIAEHFDANWTVLREDGRFFFEPGHQYEWSWLMGRYQRLTGIDLTPTRRRLFERSEAHGVDQVRRAAWDQVWSDYEPKLRSSRFWPQAERIKAAVQLGVDGQIDAVVARAAASQAMKTLFRYLDTPVAGLWYDLWGVDGSFGPSMAKASSLYHIIGAMSEYEKWRE